MDNKAKGLNPNQLLQWFSAKRGNIVDDTVNVDETRAILQGEIDHERWFWKWQEVFQLCYEFMYKWANGLNVYVIISGKIMVLILGYKAQFRMAKIVGQKGGPIFLPITQSV